MDLDVIYTSYVMVHNFNYKCKYCESQSYTYTGIYPSRSLVMNWSIYLYIWKHYSYDKMLKMFQDENPAPKHQRSLKIVVSMMVISFTLSLLVTFPELSEIYALPSRGGGGGGLRSGNAPLSGAHNNGPGSLSSLNPGSNVINGPNGPRVLNPNTPATTTAVHPSGCPTVVHPNGADTTAVHPSNCPSPNAKVTVNSGGSTSSSSSLTVNNVQQQGSIGGSTAKQSSQSTQPCLAKNTIITVNVYGAMTRDLPFKAGQTSNTVQGISVALKC
jgi:hypothetical protein